MVNPTPNQFGITPVQGQVDYSVAVNNVLQCQVSGSQGTALVAGQAVKIEDSAGALPKVLALTANTDKTFGFVARNIKDQSFPANAILEIALTGSVVWMTSGGAIARGANVEVVYTTNKVITTGGTNPVVGFTLDKATAADQDIRVFVVKP